MTGPFQRLQAIFGQNAMERKQDKGPPIQLRMPPLET
jgi:hypothetical protein